MCGIAGVLSSAPFPGLEPAAAAMQRRLAHRGRDGAGLWRAASGRAAFAHTRLAIFDPRPAAAQPMTTPDGRLTITYNGALYNVLQVREELARHGAGFDTTSDTEVILRAYERFGPACVDRFHGMFAFAIWDDAAQAAFLARDACGIKPLYYAASPERLVFASELRAVAASGLVAPDLDVAGVYGYFRRGSVPEPRTILAGVRLLPAGATATWRDGRFTIHAPPGEAWLGGGCPGPDPVAATRAALLQSVDAHFAGDVPVGVLLSGGADSAAIVALATAAGRADVRTFSLAFPGAPDDEGADAVRTAHRFGVPHRVLEVDAPVAARAFADYQAMTDQPSIDGLNTFVAARFVREEGLKVVLSGIGADELFAGYGSFWRVPALARWHRLATAFGPAASWTGALLARAPGPRARRVGDLLTQPPSLPSAYHTFRGIFTRAESRLLARHFTSGEVDDDQDQDQEQEQALADSQPQAAISSLELTHYVRNQLLRDADVMSMAAGVELRTPYVDRPLLQTLWALPPATRLQRGKRLLAQAVPEIPAWALTGRKRCFQFPFAQWRQHEWREQFAAADQASPVPTQTWYRSWCVMALQQSLQNLREARHA